VRYALGLTAVLAACVLVLASGARAAPLAWPPPSTSGAQVVKISQERTSYQLDSRVDYVLRMPSTVYARGGLMINGGRNVTLIGGHIRVPETGATALAPRRGLLLINQRGTVHVEGLQIDGRGLSEGIQLGEPYGATVQLQNIYVGTVRARDTVNFSDNHPDVLQTWAGPKVLRVDHLSGSTDLQGLFLDPLSDLCQTDACRPSSVAGRTWDLRNIDIWGTESARVLFWKGDYFPLAQRGLWGWNAAGRSLRASVWPSVDAWPALTWHCPDERMVSPADVGLGYVAGGV
jgi:hypothetical protein